jgi:hypothetical protein
VTTLSHSVRHAVTHVTTLSHKGESSHLSEESPEGSQLTPQQADAAATASDNDSGSLPLQQQRYSLCVSSSGRGYSQPTHTHRMLQTIKPL